MSGTYSDDELATMLRVSGWSKSAERLGKLVEENEDLRALAHRVYTECGPKECFHLDNSSFWQCGCWASNFIKEDIVHPPDCLHKAAEALLRKADEL